MSRADKADSAAARLAVVRRYRALHRGLDSSLDRISGLAAQIFDAPMAAVTLVDEHEVYFAGRFGLDTTATGTQPGLCATAMLRYGSTVLVDASADPQAAKHPMVMGKPRVRFYAAYPLVVADGHPIGTICVFGTEPRSIAAGQLAMLRDLAQVTVDHMELRRAAAMAIEVERNARRVVKAETERSGHIAEALHSSLVPSHLPSVPGLDVAAHYQPFASAGVGGDFFDVFPIDDRRWGIFVGDVVGKGVEAAAFTALARYSLRAAAVVDRGASQVLSDVNDVILLDPGSDDHVYCTIAYGEFTPLAHGAWRAEIAIGGHPPPLVLRQGRIEAVRAGGTIVGSFDGQRFPSATVDLAPGESIMMYSDGVTEMRSGDGWLGVDGVVDAFEGRTVSKAEEAITILREVVASNDEPLRDDLVIVSVTVPLERGSP